MGLDGTGAGMLGAVPSSFATQMAMATGVVRGVQEEDSMMGRLMLARMKTLEEGFAEIVREFKGLNSSRMGTTAGNSSVEGGSLAGASGAPTNEKGKGRVTAEKRRGKHRPGSGGGLMRSESAAVIGESKGKVNEKDNDEVENAPEGDIIERYQTKGNSL